MPGRDFEDNVAIRCAVRAGIAVITTRDLTGFAESPVPAVTPAQLIARLQS